MSDTMGTPKKYAAIIKFVRQSGYDQSSRLTSVVSIEHYTTVAEIWLKIDSLRKASSSFELESVTIEEVEELNE